VAAVTAVALIGSVVWLSVRSPSYEATSHLLVSAVQEQEQGVYLGLDLLHESVDPTRTVQTAASLVESREAAAQTAKELGGGWTTDSVLAAIQVRPEGESSILAVTGTADTADEATSLTNTFTKSAIAIRDAQVQRQLGVAIDNLKARLAGAGASGGDQTELEASLGSLEALRDRGDPTLSISELATPPSSPAGASAALVIILALLGGLAVGSAAAVVLELSTRTVRDEDDAQSVWPLPVLTRVPPLGRGHREGAIGIDAPPVIREAFRGLAVQLERNNGGGRTILVTSPSTGDGKTTSSINLATSIAADGRKVVLLDFDLRKPDVARALDLSTTNTVESLASSDAPLDRLVSGVDAVANHSVFATSSESVASGDTVIDALGGKLLRLLEEARRMAPFVVVDTPPIGEVSDALRIAHAVDEVMVVTRPGNTDRASLATVRDMLSQIGVAARGYIVVGATQRARSSYYEYGRTMREQTGRGTLPFSASSDRSS
jgi:Mrp family chromosome partitioning ATPase